MKKIIFSILFSISMLFAQSEASGLVDSVYWVDMHNGNDSNNGTSAATAFKTIHKVLATNTYLSSEVVTTTIKVMPSVVAGSPNGYYDFGDSELYLATSNDFELIGVAGPDSTIFDAESKNRHMSLYYGQSNKSIIQGITFRNGKSTNWPDGGSIYISKSTNIQFIDCVWKNNSSSYGSDGGGAIHIRDKATPSFTSCVFDSNFVDVDDNSTSGGAISIQYPQNETDLKSAIKIKKSKFSNNYVKAKYQATGGAIHSRRAIEIENSLFVNNGAISNNGGSNNSSFGGAIALNINWYDNGYKIADAYIKNSTFHGNYIKSLSSSTGDMVGAAIAHAQWDNAGQKTFIFNTIITGSRALVVNDTTDYDTSNLSSDYKKRLIVGEASPGNNKLTMDYSNVQASTSGSGWGDYVYNVSAAYKDTSNNDYSLSDKSPLIGAGVLAWTEEGIAGPTEDMLGNTRPNPSGSNPDMGAYENSLGSSSAPLPVSDLVVKRASSGAKLSWSKIKVSLGSTTDATGITYRIYQDGSVVDSTTTTSYTRTGLTNGTAYTFSVSAADSSGESAQSASYKVIPRYQGPRWHVASSGGKALSDTSSNYAYGSYDSPINHLSNALEIAASGDTIIMMKGTHTGSNNRDISFEEKKKFVISGDLSYSADQTIIDASGKGRHFKFDKSVDSSFVIQHITLYNGEADGSYGGGSVLVEQGNPKFRKVIFKANVDSTNNWGGGGAISVNNWGSVIVDSCVFDGNRRSAYSTNSSANEEYYSEAAGGAIGFWNSYSRSSIRSSTFKNNKAYSRNAAVGSALYMHSSAVDVTNSLFHNNESRASIGNSDSYNSNAVIYYQGGPVLYESNNWSGTKAILANNTIANNIATSEKSNSWITSGVHYCSHDNTEGSDPIVYAFNNIIYGNKSGSKTEEFQLQLHCGNPIFYNDYNLIYNLENLKNGGGGQGQKYLSHDYSIDVDPSFKDTANGDYSLANASLAIGAGVADWSDWGVSAPKTDMLGMVRPNPAGSSPDLGPYENSLGSSPYPKQVKNVTAKGGSGAVTLSWDPVDVNNDSITYKTYMDTKPFEINIDLHVGTNSQANNPSITISSLDNATRYYFRVTAVNGAGYEGTPSKSIDITPTYSGPVWWVATTGSDETGEGSSAAPYASLNHAIEHVTAGDTIMIKKGTYRGPENRNIEISPYRSDGLFQNFDNLKNVVITSEKGADSTIIDAEYSGLHFYMFAPDQLSLDSTFQIIGLSFINGRGNPENFGGGGGSFLITGQEYYDQNTQTNKVSKIQPKIKNCIFRDNEIISYNFNGNKMILSGGAVLLHAASAIIENCTFENNVAGYRGGALAVDNYWYLDIATINIRNSSFINNSILAPEGSPEGSKGGGIGFKDGVNAIIINSLFENNLVKNTNNQARGGAIYAGGGFDSGLDQLIWIINTRISRNIAEVTGGSEAQGGGLYMSSPFALVNSVVDSNQTSTFEQGKGGEAGGVFIGVQSSPDQANEIGRSWLVNNTIVNNIANGNFNGGGNTGGVIVSNLNQSETIWFNNIIYGNSNGPNSTEMLHANIQLWGDDKSTWMNDYNNIELSSDVGLSSQFPFGTNTYDLSPGFTGESNYSLSDGSSMIGLGIASFKNYDGPTFDYLNNSRPNPIGSNPDLGAYENALATSPYPLPVENLVGVPGSGQVSLSWDISNETDIDKYNVYMSTYQNFPVTSENFVDETLANSYTVANLINNTEYFFKVAAVDTAGYEGTPSKEISVLAAFLGPTWWISEDGDDNNDGSEFSPFASLDGAFKNVHSGDTIMVKAGTYTGTNNAGFRDYDIFYNNTDQGTEGNNQDQSMELMIRGETGNPNDVIFDGQEPNNAQRFFVFERSEPFYDKVTFEGITFQNEYHNGDDQNGQAGGGAILISQTTTELVFNRVLFKNNVADQTQFNDGGGAVHIRLRSGSISPKFIECGFVNNQVQTKNDGEWTNAFGGAVSITPGHDGFNGDPLNESAVIFDRCYFNGNFARNTNNNNNTMSSGAAIDAMGNIIVRNSLFVNNHFSGNGGMSNTYFRSVIRLEPYYQDQSGNAFSGRGLLINNTFYDNQSPKVIQMMGAPNGRGTFHVYNNIFSEYQDAAISISSEVDLDSDYNLFDKKEGNYVGINDPNSSFEGQASDIIAGPKFKNSSAGDFRLSNNSLAVDGGAFSHDGYDELGNSNAPIVDIRGYYRVGAPDIGAYETGASKFLLTLEDDIDGDMDTTFVELGQELSITVSTNDLNGNQVVSNEPIFWDIFPNQKYVSLIKGDNNTEGGDASASFQVTSQTSGKGFRFRISADVGDASLRSKMYVIEEIVTGAPPPVTDLVITPSDWTNDPNFKLDWTTPNWSEGREMIGAVMEISDGVNSYNQFLPFPNSISPSVPTSKSFEFEVPEAGQFQTQVWLVDELGNENMENSKEVTAYFDDVPPDQFAVYFPKSIEDTIYTSNKPRFIFQPSGDYPSGIKHWNLIVNDVQMGFYDNPPTNSDGDFFIEDTNNVLADGYYDWWLEAVDLAGNVTQSDTGFFGVDLSPPNINHPSPLITIDENTTSPSINANFSDAASGVNFGRLHYRRAGSGGGFVSVDLRSGPVNIPGSDIKKDGLEYYIDSEDNIGNYGYWPQDKAFQSVKVRSEAPISTASQWASGVPGKGTDSTNYWFFSIPFDVGNAKNIITSVMGQPDEFNYRLYGYNNGWQENPGSVTMGNGYFFIYDETKYEDMLPIQFDFGQGVSTATDPPFKINVSPGSWKFIGTPYNFNVPLSNVYTEDGSSINDAGSIYTWNGSWGSAGGNMQPWKGYIFKSGGATELHIDARGSSFGKLAKSVANGDDIPMNGEEWIIDIIATTGEARDEMNAVGVRHLAKDGYDRFDEFEPPVVPGNLTVRVDNRKREVSPDLYAKDIRKPNETGHYWDLQVFAPTNGLRTYLTFEGLGYIPQEYDVFLINKTTKQAKNLEWESSYRFANTGSENYLKQDFRLVVGTKKFVEDNNAGVNLYPDAFTLAQNYPNPFNPQTSIMISLEEDAQVDLIIYNLLGEEITRLAANERRPAGYYNFIWNGRNDMGTKVSTGVYFYHALIRNEQGKVVLNKTRKMIFLK